MWPRIVRVQFEPCRLKSGQGGNYQYCSSKKVSIKICRPLTSSERNLFRYHISCLLVLQILSYTLSTTRRRSRKRSRAWTKRKNSFGCNSWKLISLFFICFQYSLIRSCRLKTASKMYGGEYIAIPIYVVLPYCMIIIPLALCACAEFRVYT